MASLASTEEEGDIQALMADLAAGLEAMVQRAEVILAELNQLTELRRARDKAVVPGQKSLVHSVSGECTAFKPWIQRLRDTGSEINGVNEPGNHLQVHGIPTWLKEAKEALRCSNVPANEATWDIVKRCNGLERFACRFSCHPEFGTCDVCTADWSSKSRGKTNGAAEVPQCPPRTKQKPADLTWVDAVVDGGAKWVRVVGTDEQRLLLHMAQGGWDWEADDGADDEETGGVAEALQEFDIPAVVTVRKLVQAARANRHNYRVPRVHIVFTRITEGRNADIDRLIYLLRCLGETSGTHLTVDCADSDFLRIPPPPANIALQNLLVDELLDVTPTVNLDCTALIDLASDITHSDVEIQPWHRHDVVSQITSEREKGSSLVRFLYPVLRGRTLVCARAAAAHFRKIVGTMATPAEEARASILLPTEGAVSGEGPSTDLLDMLQALSKYPVDPDLRLPIKVVDEDVGATVSEAVASGRLPAVATAVAPALHALDRSIFFYGWVAGVTTITGNNTSAKQIVRLVEEYRTRDEEAGPKVYVCPITRALATKGRPKAGAETETEI